MDLFVVKVVGFWLVLKVLFDIVRVVIVVIVFMNNNWLLCGVVGSVIVKVVRVFVGFKMRLVVLLLMVIVVFVIGIFCWMFL